MAPWVYVDFDPSEFKFVTAVEDDGEGKGGGWQEARINLKFKKLTIPRKIRSWSCDFIVGMPIRTEFMGRIERILAVRLSEEITEEVANRMDYDLPQVTFCGRFVDEADDAFKSKYPLLGARVMRP